jgi:L-lysine 2,3-aminomutase
MGGSVSNWWPSLALCVRQTQQVYILCQPDFLFICRHESGNTTIGVRVDRQRQLMQVLRFGIGGYGSMFLSLAKPPSYLRLKTTNPRRHRPIR